MEASGEQQHGDDRAGGGKDAPRESAEADCGQRAYKGREQDRARAAKPWDSERNQGASDACPNEIVSIESVDFPTATGK